MGDYNYIDGDKVVARRPETVGEFTSYFHEWDYKNKNWPKGAPKDQDAYSYFVSGWFSHEFVPGGKNGNCKRYKNCWPAEVHEPRELTHVECDQCGNQMPITEKHTIPCVDDYGEQTITVDGGEPVTIHPIYVINHYFCSHECADKWFEDHPFKSDDDYNPADAPDAISVGKGHYLRQFGENILWWHPGCAEETWTLLELASGKNHRITHGSIATKDITLTPSLRCPDCPAHGWVHKGRYGWSFWSFEDAAKERAKKKAEEEAKAEKREISSALKEAEAALARSRARTFQAEEDGENDDQLTIRWPDDDLDEGDPVTPVRDGIFILTIDGYYDSATCGLAIYNDYLWYYSLHEKSDGPEGDEFYLFEMYGGDLENYMQYTFDYIRDVCSENATDETATTWWEKYQNGVDPSRGMAPQHSFRAANARWEMARYLES